FIGSATRYDGDHGSVSEAFGDGSPDAGFALTVMVLVVLVLGGGEVAGVRVERLEQPVQRTVGDLGDVRLLNVLTLDAREDFAINAELAVCAVVRSGGSVNT